eukprot:GHVO01068177.1.p1 GENE.GHVO01068177.1~~GHVO01068177.1.p1  ORF type:complete len:670 (+),score=108.89 GHVO01068177.1:211-2220(+)
MEGLCTLPNRINRVPLQIPRLPLQLLRESFQSPRELLQSPREPLQSPRQPLQSPRQPLQSPRQPLQSPRQPLQSPRQPLQSPRQPFQSPMLPLQTPKQTLQSPKQTTISLTPLTSYTLRFSNAPIQIEMSDFESAVETVMIEKNRSSYQLIDDCPAFFILSTSFENDSQSDLSDQDGNDHTKRSEPKTPQQKRMEMNTETYQKLIRHRMSFQSAERACEDTSPLFGNSENPHGGIWLRSSSSFDRALKWGSRLFGFSGESLEMSSSLEEDSGPWMKTVIQKETNNYLVLAVDLGLLAAKAFVNHTAFMQGKLDRDSQKEVDARLRIARVLLYRKHCRQLFMSFLKSSIRGGTSEPNMRIIFDEMNKVYGSALGRSMGADGRQDKRDTFSYLNERQMVEDVFIPLFKEGHDDTQSFKDMAFQRFKFIRYICRVRPSQSPVNELDKQTAQRFAVPLDKVTPDDTQRPPEALLLLLSYILSLNASRITAPRSLELFLFDSLLFYGQLDLLTELLTVSSSVLNSRRAIAERLYDFVWGKGGKEDDDHYAIDSNDASRLNILLLDMCAELGMWTQTASVLIHMKQYEAIVPILRARNVESFSVSSLMESLEVSGPPPGVLDTTIASIRAWQSSNAALDMSGTGPWFIEQRTVKSADDDDEESVYIRPFKIMDEN